MSTAVSIAEVSIRGDTIFQKWLWMEKSYIRNEQCCPTAAAAPVLRRAHGTPLDSETGWPGLWLVAIVK